MAGLLLFAASAGLRLLILGNAGFGPPPGAWASAFGVVDTPGDTITLRDPDSGWFCRVPLRPGLSYFIFPPRIPEFEVFPRTFEVHPRVVKAYRAYRSGRLEDALSAFRDRAGLRGDGPAVARMGELWCHLALGDYPEAMKLARELAGAVDSLSLDRRANGAYLVCLGYALACLGAGRRLGEAWFWQLASRYHLDWSLAGRSLLYLTVGLAGVEEVSVPDTLVGVWGPPGHKATSQGQIAREILSWGVGSLNLPIARVSLALIPYEGFPSADSLAAAYARLRRKLGEGAPPGVLAQHLLFFDKLSGGDWKLALGVVEALREGEPGLARGMAEALLRSGPPKGVVRKLKKMAESP